MLGGDDYDAAFSTLYPAACRVAYRLLRDVEAAEDVASEAMGRAWTAWWRIRHLPHRDAWVLRVAANLAVDTLRRRERYSRKLEILAGGTRDAASSIEDVVVLQSVLDRLPGRQRDVLALRFLADMSEAEVAAALHISPGTVKQHVHRGLARLRRLADKEDSSLVFD